jgi:hypothetical protein
MGNKFILPAVMVMATNGIRFIDDADSMSNTEQEMLNQHNEMKYNLVQSVQGLKSELEFGHSEYLRQ